MHDTDFHLSYTRMYEYYAFTQTLIAKKRTLLKSAVVYHRPSLIKLVVLIIYFEGQTFMTFLPDVSKQMGLSVLHFNPL